MWSLQVVRVILPISVYDLYVTPINGFLTNWHDEHLFSDSEETSGAEKRGSGVMPLIVVFSVLCLLVHALLSLFVIRKQRHKWLLQVCPSKSC